MREQQDIFVTLYGHSCLDFGQKIAISIAFIHQVVMDKKYFKLAH